MAQAVNGSLLDKATQLTNAYGKRFFGEHFSLSNRYSLADGGFSGELEAVIPLLAFAGFTAGNAAGADPQAFSLQHGITRYTDGQGLLRNVLCATVPCTTD